MTAAAQSIEIRTVAVSRDGLLFKFVGLAVVTIFPAVAWLAIIAGAVVLRRGAGANARRPRSPSHVRRVVDVDLEWPPARFGPRRHPALRNVVERIHLSAAS